MAQIATIPVDLENALKRFRSSSPPMICYIDRGTDRSGPPILRLDTGVLEDGEKIDLDELADKLPNAPRYIIFNHTPNGSAFSKVIFINWMPRGYETAASMLHVGTLPALEKLTRVPKVIEVNDEEDLTSESIDAKIRR